MKNNLNYLTFKKKLISIFFSFLAITIVTASASTSVGTISVAEKLARVCHDQSCTSYGQINFAPTINASTTGAVAISITDSGITGNAYGDQIGWINMRPTGSGVGVNAASGALSGYAYSSVGSWINFAPTGQSVVINSSGEFVGWAWVSGAYGGWLRFDCSFAGTCVKTDWRPVASRGVTPPGSGGAGTGGGIVFNPNLSPTAKPITTKNVLPLLPQPPKGVTPETVINTQPEVNQNTYDKNKDGKPDVSPIAPEKIEADREYREILPAHQNVFSSGAECLFCVVVRHTPRAEVAQSGEEKYIIKFGFVPKYLEIPIPLGLKVSDKNGVSDRTATHVDATSAGATLAALAGLWRLLLPRVARFLITRS